MYKKLSKVFISTIPIFSLGLITTPVYSIDNNNEDLIVASKINNLTNKIIVTNEQELRSALNDQNISEIIVEGNITIVNDIDLSNSSREITITVGSQNVLDSSLVVVQGVKINGDNKLTLIKNNDSEKSLIEFRRIVNRRELPQTLFTGMTILGNNQEVAINNTIDNLVLNNIALHNLTLFKNLQNSSTIFKRINFVNSSVDYSKKYSPEIRDSNIIRESNAVCFTGNVSKEFSPQNLKAIGVDDSGEIVEGELFYSYDNYLEMIFENLKSGTDYNLYVLNVDEKNESVFLSSPHRVTTFNFESYVESAEVNSAKIRITKNELDEEYYPLHLVLKCNGVEFKNVEIPRNKTAKTTVLNITGLKEDSGYTYEIISYVDSDNPKMIDKGSFMTLKNPEVDQNNLNFTLSQEDLKKSNIEDIRGTFYLNEKIFPLVNGGKNFKVSLDGIDLKIIDNKLILENFIPGKEYGGLKIYFDTKDNKKAVINISKFKTLEETSDLNEFVKRVYKNALDREADEKGFWYWVNNIRIRKTNLREFVANILNEREFIDKRPTIESKIEGLYKVIVDRIPDSEGLAFWISKYKELIKRECSEDLALKVIVDQMMNEQEFINIITNIENNMR